MIKIAKSLYMAILTILNDFSTGSDKIALAILNRLGHLKQYD